MSVNQRQALALVETLGMRPLVAHCCRALGMLYARTQQPAQAYTALTRARDLYGDLAMTFWLPQTEGVLASVAPA